MKQLIFIPFLLISVVCFSQITKDRYFIFGRDTVHGLTRAIGSPYGIFVFGNPPSDRAIARTTKISNSDTIIIIKCNGCDSRIFATPKATVMVIDTATLKEIKFRCPCEFRCDHYFPVPISVPCDTFFGTKVNDTTGLIIVGSSFTYY